MIRALAALLATAGAAFAEPVDRVDPEELAPRLAGRMNFETLPLTPEPGLNWDRPLTGPGLSIGAAFVGQHATGSPHDRLIGAPTAPLSLAAPLPGTHLSTAFHPGLGSNALFGLGPAGFPVIEARGEGSVALLFSREIKTLTLKLHAEYADPLGTRPPPGAAFIRFYAGNGALIDSHEIALTTGIMALGFRLLDGSSGFAGVTLTNTDPGGIAIDDIRYPLDGPTS